MNDDYKYYDQSVDMLNKPEQRPTISEYRWKYPKDSEWKSCTLHPCEWFPLSYKFEFRWKE